jgi:hypothetical protein
MISKNDLVTGWWGTGIVTDVAYGFITDDTGAGPVDNMVRIKQYKNNKPIYRYVYKEDIR